MVHVIPQVSLFSNREVNDYEIRRALKFMN